MGFSRLIVLLSELNVKSALLLWISELDGELCTDEKGVADGVSFGVLYLAPLKVTS